MGRRKIRNYPSIEEYEERFREYLTEHRESLVNYAAKKLGYDDVDSMRDAEYAMKFGFDCGWAQLIPRNSEMYREWRLDNGDYGACIFDVGNTAYPTQSCTIKRLILEKALEEMNLENEFYINERLD